MNKCLSFLKKQQEWIDKEKAIRAFYNGQKAELEQEVKETNQEIKNDERPSNQYFYIRIC